MKTKSFHGRAFYLDQEKSTSVLRKAEVVCIFNMEKRFDFFSIERIEKKNMLDVIYSMFLIFKKYEREWYV